MPYPVPMQVKEVFSASELEDLLSFVKTNIRGVDEKLQDFRTNKLPEMVRLYKGLPKNKEADFPWPGAANLVIQLIGTFSDDLLSRIMGAIYMYDPLFMIELLGDNPDMTGEEMKNVLQKFLMDEAYDPSALNFYRNEQAFFNSAIKYGTAVMELPWEYEVEKNYVYVSGGVEEGSKVVGKFNEFVRRDGPTPKLVPLNKFGIDPRVPSLDTADFFYTKETLNYYQVKNLPGRNDLYKDAKEILEDILQHPDRTEQEEMQRVETDSAGIQGTTGYETGGAEWDFYNCYIRYRKGNETYSIFVKYNNMVKKIVYAIFNIYPDNLAPVEDAKLSYDDEGYFGFGYAQMLRSYQKELSQNSNWRTNNRNFSMLGIFRVDPDSKLSSILQMYPGVMVPAKERTVERIQAGADVGYNNEPDAFIMSCAKERAGIDPAIGGTGGGVVNSKRGIYSAAGTSMVLMQQNNRNNLRMSDMRAAHVRIANKLMQMYSNFGIGGKLKKYGNNSDTLKSAFEAYKNGTLGLRLRPTTAANNKELERQNDILLSNAMAGFYERNAQMIQAIMQPGMPPQLSEYYQQILLANSALYRTILRNFNHDDVSRLLPAIPKFGQNAGPGPIQGGGGVNANPGGSNPGAGSDYGAIPVGDIQASTQIPI